MYYSDNEYYPTTNGDSCAHTSGSIFDTAAATNPLLSSNYLKKVIDDPVNKTVGLTFPLCLKYVYVPAGGAFGSAGYELYASMESKGDKAYNGTAGYGYKVTNP